MQEQNDQFLQPRPFVRTQTRQHRQVRQDRLPEIGGQPYPSQHAPPPPGLETPHPHYSYCSCRHRAGMAETIL